MAEIAVEPFVMKDVSLVIGGGANDYKGHCSRVRFDPNVTRNTVTWKGLSPTARFSESTQQPAAWTAALAIAQDWENAASLANYLLEHEGEEVVCLFEPKAGGQAFGAILVLAPPTIGGDVDAVATSEVVLGVVGKPELVAP